MIWNFFILSLAGFFHIFFGLLLFFLIILVSIFFFLYKRITLTDHINILLYRIFFLFFKKCLFLQNFYLFDVYQIYLFKNKSIEILIIKWFILKIAFKLFI